MHSVYQADHVDPSRYRCQNSFLSLVPRHAHSQSITFNSIPTTLPPPPSTRSTSLSSSYSTIKDSALAQKRTTAIKPRPSLPTLKTVATVTTTLKEASANEPVPGRLLALMSLPTDMSIEPVDWDQFLVDADLTVEGKHPAHG